MKILPWLFKVAHQEQASENNIQPSPTIKENYFDHHQRDNNVKDIVVIKHQRRHRRSEKVGIEGKFWSKNFSPFAILCRKDVAKACFYSTLHLRRVNSQKRRQQECWVDNSMKMKKEEVMDKGFVGTSNFKADHSPSTTSHVVGNKVLPISSDCTTTPTLSSSINKNDQGGASDNKNNKVKRERSKTVSRMKELIRWAAAARSDKGGNFLGRKVLQFRNRATLKAVPDDDQLSNESPKISFRWEVESCSTTSSVYSAISMASSKNDHIQTVNMVSLNSTPAHDHRRGNWITTDSEFVVLEL